MVVSFCLDRDYFAAYLFADREDTVTAVHGGETAADAAGVKEKDTFLHGVAGRVSMAVEDGVHPALELREQAPLEAEGENAAVPVYDTYALAPYFHQVLLGQPWDVRIMIAGHTAEIADLLEVVDKVFGVEIAEMNDHVHPGQSVD